MNKKTTSLVEDEIESWKGFVDALRSEDRDLFKDMMNICRKYSVEIEVAERTVTTEALFMTILLAQHKMIKWLQKQLQSMKV
jgi:hypothetical protein